MTGRAFTVQQQRDFAAAHAEGLHDPDDGVDFSREGCPECGSTMTAPEAPSLDILTRRPLHRWTYDRTHHHGTAHARALAYGCIVLGDDDPADDGPCSGSVSVLWTRPAGDGEACGIGWYAMGVCAGHLPVVARRIEP